MQTTPLDPKNPGGAQVVDGMALQAPIYNPHNDPASLQGTMTQTPNRATTTGTGGGEKTPAVVTSNTARTQTKANQQQLADIQAGLDRAKQMANEIQAREAEERAKNKGNTAADQAMGEAGYQGPQKTPEQIEAENALRNTMSQLDMLQASMDARSGGLIDSIKAEYDSLILQQEEINKAYEAGITTEGYRSGRARYAPLLQGQIITGAISAGLQKIADINMKKNRLIMEAENARDERNFAMLQTKMQMYRETVKEERALAQQMYENAMNASKEAREQVKFTLEAYSNLPLSSLESMDEGQLKNIDVTLGMPTGSTKQLLVASAKANQAKSEKEALATRQTLLNILQDIPQGQTVTFPDGTQYTGLGKISDTVTYQVKNPQTGMVSILSYNKATGGLQTVNAGYYGTDDSGTDTAGGIQLIDQARQYLYKGVQPDGAFNPEVYINVRNVLLQENPKLVKELDNTYLKEDVITYYFSPSGIKMLKQQGLVVLPENVETEEDE